MYTIIKFDEVAPSGINVTPEYIAARLKDELSNQLILPLAENISSTVKNYLDKHTEKFLPSGIYKIIDNKIFKYTIDSNNFSEFSNPNLDAAFEDLYLEHQYLIGYKDIIEKIHKNCTTGYYPKFFTTPVYSYDISNHQLFSNGMPIYEFIRMFALGDLLKSLYTKIVKIIYNTTDIEIDKYVILMDNSKPISAISSTNQIKFQITDTTITELEDLLKNYLDQKQCKIFIKNIKNLFKGILKFDSLYDDYKYTLYKNIFIIDDKNTSDHKIILTPELAQFLRNLRPNPTFVKPTSFYDFIHNTFLQEFEISHPSSSTAKFKIVHSIDSDNVKKLVKKTEGKIPKSQLLLPTILSIRAPSGIRIKDIKSGDIVYLF